MSGVSGGGARRSAGSAAEPAHARVRGFIPLFWAAALLACSRESVDLLPGAGGGPHAGAPSRAPNSAGFRPAVGEPEGGAGAGSGGHATSPSGGSFGDGTPGTGGGFGGYGCRMNAGRCDAFGQVCDPINDRCIAGCTLDQDCTRGSCEGGQCVECWGDPDCTTRGAGRHCVVYTCVECVMPGECPPERPVCDYGLFCRPCGSDMECPPGQSCGYGRCR